MQAITNFIETLLKKSTPKSPAWNIEHIREEIPPAWNYIDGCMIKAILDVHKATNNKKYLTFAKDYIDFFLSENGTKILGYTTEEYNCDQVNKAKVLFDLYKETNDQKYKNAIELIYSQLKTHPRTKEGNFWHKKIYPNQIWLDGLYMVQPFYIEYDMLLANKANYKDSFAQFENVEKIMKDPTTDLYFHGYDASREMFWADKETGLSQNFWTRSMGWYTMALVDTIEKLDEQLFYEYETLQGYLKNALDALLKYADPATHLYYQVTNQGNKEGNYLETSGSCAIAYSLMKGARLGYLPEYYYNHGKQIFDAVVEHKLVLQNGEFTLKDVCLIAGLGGMAGKGTYKVRDGTYEYYISEPRVDNDAKGVAPFLFCFAEVIAKEEGRWLQ